MVEIAPRFGQDRGTAMHNDVTRLVGACLAVSEQIQAVHQRLDDETEGSAWTQLREIDTLIERLRWLAQAVEAALYAWMYLN